ncbi:MAG: DNA polymerase I [Candidatus Omnitrophica bacterium]|nr:DNA polymerase I [Candidatus Omnitrophota bacterium]
MALQRVFLIDGTAFCYRAFYAIRALSTLDGRPTNAVYGVATMLKALQEKEHPDGLAVAFDTGKPTFRHQQFAAYKIQRKPMPDPLISQLPLVKRLLAAYRIPVFEREGFEGEDVLASIAKRLAGPGVEVFLVTGDKDALQLVNSHIKVYNPHKDDAVLDAAAVKQRYGIGPERIVDLMGLMGDEIDNIPGVPGVGEKTAVELLKQFGSIDALYAHLEQVDSPARRKALEAAREQVQRARQLARIETDVPIELHAQDMKLQEPDWKALRALFRELEFKRLLAELDASAPTPGGASEIAMAEHPQQIAQCLTQLERGAAAAIGCWPAGDSAVFAVATAAEPVWVLRLNRLWLVSPEGGRLQRWLADARAPKIGHDVKAAMRWLGTIGCRLAGIAGDTMVAAYLLNPARTEQSLPDLADEYLDERVPAPPAVQEAETLEGSEDLRLFARFVSAILPLHRRLNKVLADQQLSALYTELELPLLAVLARMEAAGIAIDRPYLAGLKATMDTRLLQLTEEIHRLAGAPFNLNSPKQLAQVLFERLKLPVIKRTKTGPSTDAGVLQQLAEQHPLPKQLMEYRELSKLVSTYVDALPQLAHPATGRVHTSFNQAATATGRLSSSEPNLQNIPIKTELGRLIRKAFIAGIPDGLLVTADYSQIELRILAHLSGDEALSEAFRQGRDIHRYTASLIYGIPEAEVQPEQRNAMKAVNFGILYGMSSHGLSKELGMSFEDAQAFIDAYFQRYPKVRAYLDGQIAKARREGFVQTLLGRRRYIPEVNSPDAVLRQVGERMAINAPVQGTAADLIKRAMVDMDRRLAHEGLSSRMVVQVHDELVFECPKKELAALARLAKRVMEGAIELSVPLIVTVKAGVNWLDLSPVN